MSHSRLFILGLLIVATTLEVSGDAIVRSGLGQQHSLARIACFVGGGLLLFGYGYALNSAPIEFEKVVGLYIATLFVVWQIIAFVISRNLPSLPILAGGLLIVAGGLIVSFWQPSGANGPSAATHAEDGSRP